MVTLVSSSVVLDRSGISLRRKRRHRKSLKQGPYFKCWKCEHNVRGKLDRGALVMSRHCPDTGMVVDNDAIGCTGIAYPELAVLQQICISP